MMLSEASHSVDWLQVIATTTSVIVGLVAIITFLLGGMEKYRRRNNAALLDTIHKVTDAIVNRLDKVDDHLVLQDKNLKAQHNRLYDQSERLARVEGKLGKVV